MLIFIVQILSHDLCVKQIMVGNMWWNFTLQILDMADKHGIKMTVIRCSYYKLNKIPR